MDYQNGKIYCISNGDLYYIGSTIQGLRERLRGHRADYNKFIDGKEHYRSSYEIIKSGPHKISLLENYPCDSKTELEIKEYEIIKQYKELHGNKCVNINGVLPKQTEEEYAEKSRIRANAYYAENKDKCAEKMKEYYELNKEKLKEKSREYGIKNKEDINAKRLIIIECDCGSQYTLTNKNRHLKSKKHLDNLTKNNIVY